MSFLALLEVLERGISTLIYVHLSHLELLVVFHLLNELICLILNCGGIFVARPLEQTLKLVFVASWQRSLHSLLSHHLHLLFDPLLELLLDKVLLRLLFDGASKVIHGGQVAFRRL